MSDPLLLEGSIPGLLRRCAPVVVFGTCGVIVQDAPMLVALASGEDYSGGLGRLDRLDDALLDLRDPAGRDIAARWTGEAMKIRHSYAAAPPWKPASAWDGWGWCIGSGHGAVMFHGVPLRRGWGTRMRVFVPALASIHPRDSALLPDGSRLVDALALAAVVRHLAGVAS